MYTCDVCGMLFAKREYLTEHLRDRHRCEKPFICEVCCMQFSLKNDLTKHSAVHSGTDLFPCEFCDQSFSSTQSLINHLYNCDGVERLSSCGSDAESVQSEADLFELDQAEAECNISCKYCHALLSTADYKNHFCHASFGKNHSTAVSDNESLYRNVSCSKSTHSKNNSIGKNQPCAETEIICKSCHASLSKADFANHLCFKQSSEKVWQYNKCSELKQSQDKLNENAQLKAVELKDNKKKEKVFKKRKYSKTGKHVFRCKKCHEKYDAKSSFITVHQCSVGSKGYLSPPVHDSEDSSSSESSDGNIKRNKKFVDKSLIVENISLREFIQRGQWHGKKPYYCEACSRVFTLRSHLNDHQCSNESADPNSVLKLEFSYRGNDIGGCYFKMLVVKDHTGNDDPIFYCEICHRIFKKRLRLKFHKHKSINAETFLCPERGSRFETRLNLLNNSLVHHMKYHCEICCKVFSTNESFYNHTHLQVYCVCSTCSGEFASKHAFERHNCTDSFVPYSCLLCHTKFSSRIDLISHKHKEPFFKMVSQMARSVPVDENCTEAVADNSLSSHSHIDESAGNVSDSHADNEINISYHSEKGTNQDVFQDDVKLYDKADLTDDSDAVSLKPSSTNSRDENVISKSFSNRNEKDTNAQILDHSSEVVYKDKSSNQIVEVIIVEQNSQNVDQESVCDDNSFTSFERADSETNLAKHSDSVDENAFENASQEEITLSKNSSQSDAEITKPPKSNKHRKKRFSCNFCKKQFLFLLSLKNHMSFSHLNENDQTNDEEELGRLRDCQKECPECGKVFKAFYMKYHMRTHLGAKPFSCPQCSMLFSHKQNLTRHLRNMHSVGDLRCCYCKMTFSSKQDLRAHLKESHPSVPKYRCKDCGSCLMTYWHYLKHRKLHHGLGKTYVCPYCDKVCINSYLLKEHLQTHESEKSFECVDCHKKFRLLKSLRRHLKQHLGEYRFKCSHCGKSFYSNSHLQIHMRVHTGEKPHLCPECGRGFSQSGSLMYHMRIHTGEKPFSCPHCQKAFSHKCSYKSHKCLKIQDS